MQLFVFHRVNRSATELAHFTEAFSHACIHSAPSAETTPAIQDVDGGEQSSPDFSKPPVKWRKQNVDLTGRRDSEEIHSKWINDINSFDVSPAGSSSLDQRRDEIKKESAADGQRSKRKRKRKNKNKLPNVEEKVELLKETVIETVLPMKEKAGHIR